MRYNKMYIKRGKEESLLRFHPWIFSGAVRNTDGELSEGDVVEVYSNDNNFLGVGHYQIGSITVRILSFTPVTIDAAFWTERIRAAYDFRRSIGFAGSDTSNTYRLVHGEGDFLPGLIVDVYGGTAVVQAHSVGMHLARTEIAGALREVLGDTLQRIYYKSEGTLPYKAELGEENEYLFGDGSGEPHRATENGLTFEIDWLKGQKTGFFIDQRDNRALLRQYADGRSVLNMFCYTGGFSVYALQGGAKSVHSVDSSAKAISLTDANVALNFPDDTRHVSFAEDAFRFLEQTDDKYDLIILDPPAFAKHRDSLRNGLQGYRKLNSIALRKIRKGGILFTFSCSQIVSKTDFRLAVFSAAAQTRRNVRILHQLTQPADHPVNIYHPESEYLKGLVLQID
ncbi:MAG: class I SAM-dependent rRNA methyltransferase [Tannerella sp.]|jgi:23S rRNA (cytosine1962-C5)-methyltransferase|nr:class I SAM-dependent rRNA methyltransferase [Tannerella sp.]